MFSARENVVMCPAFFPVGFGFNFPSWPVSSSFNAVAGRLRTVVDLAQLVELFAEELRRRLYLGSSNTQIATALMHVIFFCSHLTHPGLLRELSA